MTRSKAIFLSIAAVAVLCTAYFAIRAYRVADFAYGAHQQVKLLIESRGTIGEAPASQTFSVDYLEAIFGDNPDLLDELKNIVQSGLSDAPALNLGEVSAMVVTYHKNEEDEVSDVVAHVVGGFPLGKLKPGFHRDGYFKNLIEENVWVLGNQAVGVLGRDMVLFAKENVADEQKVIIEGLLDGNIMPLVDRLETPMHFTVVMPDPRRLVPRQLKSHVQAIVLKGSLSQSKGHVETILLTPSSRSASYALMVISDLKRISEITLKTKFSGIVQHREWGKHIDPWWAYEMVTTSEEATIAKEENIIRISSDFDRVMVNVVLKSLERMGRDLAQTRMSIEDRMDPRLVDRVMRATKPLHYWSNPHRWGPNWPIPPTTNEIAEFQAKIPVPSEEPTPLDPAPDAPPSA